MKTGEDEDRARASAFQASRPADQSVSATASSQLSRQHTFAGRHAAAAGGAAAFFLLLLGLPAVGAQSGWLAADGSTPVNTLSTGGSRIELTSANAPVAAAISLHGGDFRSLAIADGNGGAVTMSDGALASFTSTIFVGNSADAQGGALFLTDGAAVSFIRTNFTENTAIRGGGAIYASTSGTSVALQECVFVSNSAENNGGAIYAITQTSVTAQGCTFISNFAGGKGGAIRAEGGSSVTLWGSTFVSNSATQYAGHVSANGPPFFYVYGTTFTPFVSGTTDSIALNVLAGCEQYHCNPGHGCSYTNYSLSCTPCPGSTFSSDGVTCAPCEIGSGPNTDRTACEPCGPTEFGVGVCQSCPYPSLVSEDRISCAPCVTGHGPSADRTRCVRCSGSTFSTVGVCQPCAAGEVSNEARSSCILLPVGTAINDVGVIGDLLAATDPAQFSNNATTDRAVQAATPQVTLAAQADPQVLNNSATKVAFIADIRLTLAASLNVSVDIMKVTNVRASTRDMRRLQGPEIEAELVAHIGIQFDFEIFDTANARSLLQEFGRQLQDEASALRTAGAVGIDASVPVVYRLVCQPGNYMDRGVCSGCAAGTVAADGLQSICKSCDPGTYARPGSADCKSCESGKADDDLDPATPCSPCAAGRFASFQQSTGVAICAECPLGRTSFEATTRCNLCPTHYFGYAMDGNCSRCSDIELPSRLPTNVERNDLQALLANPATCPGGQPGTNAVITPLAGVWIHVNPDRQRVELLPCQSAPAEGHIGACEGSSVSANSLSAPATAAANQEALAAICGTGYTGFLCGSCAESFEKIGGDCLECTSFNWAVLGKTLLTNIAIAIFLLHKSTKPVISAEEMQSVWNKVDIEETGRLNAAAVGEVLAHLGCAVSAQQLEKIVTHLGVDKDGLVEASDFVREQRKSAPTQSLATTIFFVQSLGLILKDANFFGVLSALNLDLESAIGQCVAPMSTTERFKWKVVLTPLVLAASVFAAVPVWNLLRGKLIPQAVWDRVQAPPRATKIHVKRALLNVYLFCYAPLTQDAVSMLVCFPTCTEGPECVDVLSIDYGVSCSGPAATQHHFGAIVAWLTLAVFSVLIPVLLVAKAKQSVARRDRTLSLRMTEMLSWFDELDADGSGVLEMAEVKQLLVRMRQPTNEQSLQRVGSEFAGMQLTMHRSDTATRLSLQSFRHLALANAGFQQAVRQPANGRASTGMGTVVKEHTVEVDKECFSAWCRYKCTEALEDPFDVLYGTTHSSAFFWFAQVLWVKTGINVLFSFSRAAEPSDALYQWQIWMIVLLCMSVCASQNLNPYINKVDQQMELVALLCLACIASVGSLSKSSGGELAEEYLALLAFLCLVPFIALVALKAQEARRSKKEKQEAQNSRVSNNRGRDGWGAVAVTQQFEADTIGVEDLSDDEARGIADDDTSEQYS